MQHGPLVSDQQAVTFKKAMANFINFILIETQTLAPLSADERALLEDLKVSAVALNTALPARADGTSQTMPASNELKASIQKLLLTLLVSEQVVPRDLAEQMYVYFRLQGLRPINTELLRNLFIRMSKQDTLLGQLVGAQVHDNKKLLAADRYLKLLSIEAFKNQEIPQLKYALSTGDGNNCGLHAFIHTDLEALLQLPVAQIQEQMDRNPMLAKTIHAFMASHPRLKGSLERLVAFNNIHNSKAEREVLWNEVMRSVVRANREEFYQSWFQNNFDHLIEKAGENAMGIADSAKEIFMTAGEPGAVIEAMVLAEYGAQLGNDVVILDRQGDVQVTAPARHGRARNTVRPVFNINGQGSGNAGNHYDFLLDTPEAMHAHTFALLNDYEEKLSGIMREIRSTTSNLVEAQNKPSVSDEALDAKILKQGESMQDAKDMYDSVKADPALAQLIIDRLSANKPADTEPLTMEALLATFTTTVEKALTKVEKLLKIRELRKQLQNLEAIKAMMLNASYDAVDKQFAPAPAAAADNGAAGQLDREAANRLRIAVAGDQDADAGDVEFATPVSFARDLELARAAEKAQEERKDESNDDEFNPAWDEQQQMDYAIRMSNKRQ